MVNKNNSDRKEDAKQSYKEGKLNIYTAQYNYKGANRMDITVKSSNSVFAPSWSMVMDYLKSNKDNIAEKIYIEKYNNILREHKKELDELIHSNKIIVLVCFCRAGAFCHRILLAKHLESMGAIYHGEIK